jgi:hypothetical protein
MPTGVAQGVSGKDGTTTGTRRALIFCGHPGDAEHEEIYAAVLESLTTALTGRCRFPADQVPVWHGAKPQEAKKPSHGVCRGPATWEAIQGGVRELREKLKPEDTLWVFVMGHAHFDGRRVFFNLPGPDADAEQFGKLFQGIECREQVFFITTPASGYAIKFLSQKGRVVITATEADREVNATISPVLLAEVLSNPPPAREFDVDGDGRITLLDLYVTVSRRVLQAYAEAKNIPTEHAQLDDNGDGRGTEVQLDYLEEELGGRRRAGPPPQIKQGQDGALAATIDLSALLRGSPAASPQQKPPAEKPGTSKPDGATPNAKPDGLNEQAPQAGRSLKGLATHWLCLFWEAGLADHPERRKIGLGRRTTDPQVAQASPPGLSC